MFCYQDNQYFSPALPCGAERFWEIVDSRVVAWKIKTRRDILNAVRKGDFGKWLKDSDFQKFCMKEENKRGKAGEAFKQLDDEKRLLRFANELKSSLPCLIFAAREFDEKPMKKNPEKLMRRRVLEGIHLNGLFMFDADHVENPKEVFERSQQEGFPWEVVLAHVTSSNEGLRLVCKIRMEVGNIADNQIELAKALGVKADASCIDASRISYAPMREDIYFINEDELMNFYHQEFDEKFTKEYQLGHTDPTDKRHSFESTESDASNHTPSPLRGTSPSLGEELLPTTWHGHDVQTIIDKRYEKKLPCKEDSNRHKESLKLASDLLVMLDGDKKAVLQLVKAQSWVQEIIEERNEDVEQTVDSAAERMAEREKKYLSQSPSKAMQEAIEAVTGKTYKGLILPIEGEMSEGQRGSDIYASLPLEEWAEEIQDLAKSFPCMKELFMNVHPLKLPTVLFSSAAMLGTLMTRTWYHFWYEPDIERRLNYNIFVIGDPGAGKNLIEKIYNILIEPVKEKDRLLVEQLNDYKDGRTERSTSTKAQKGEALKRPVLPIRLHPARTGTGEFIRHMVATKETVQGRTIHLHMFSFDSELDNVTSNSKGADWKNRDAMELKAFHNEEDGQMFGNIESVSGTFYIYWNCVYTGTPYALGRKVTQRNFGNGLATRLAVIPMPDVGIASRYQKRDPKAKEVLSEWAYRLDKVEGELPIEPLNDVTYEWQSSHLEIAEFNNDKADRTLLKRVPYYGIGVAIPFILMRHWNEWQAKKTLTMDEKDKRLCRLAMEIQYRCQHFFFGEMAHIYFADQGKVFVSRKRTSRYQECYSKLPDNFTTKQFMEVFECGQSAASKAINRFVKEGVVKLVKYRHYKKVLMALS